MSKKNFEVNVKKYEKEIDVTFDLFKFLYKLKAHCSPDYFNNYFHEDDFSPSYGEEFVSAMATYSQNINK